MQNYTIPLKIKNCRGRFFRVDELMSAPESVMVNLMLMFDGADVSLSGASYRVEMLDVDSSTGAFAFGMLRRKDSPVL